MSIIARPALNVVACSLLWLAWALNQDGWIGNYRELRLWVGYWWSGLLLLFLLFIAWLFLVVRNLRAWRQRPQRAQVHANLLCLMLAVILCFVIPSKAVTMFYFWHDDFQKIAQYAQQIGPDPDKYMFHGHWKYGTVSTDSAPGGGVSVVFDYGVFVVGILYNPHDKPIESEITGFCDPNYTSGGFIRRLEPNWFLCENRLY